MMLPLAYLTLLAVSQLIPVIGPRSYCGDDYYGIALILKEE
jgi:hypothetical protein